METIDERVKKIVIEQLGVKEDEVKNEASFVDDLGADSLDTENFCVAQIEPAHQMRAVYHSDQKRATPYTFHHSHAMFAQ